jgi:hypothetical protein
MKKKLLQIKIGIMEYRSTIFMLIMQNVDRIKNFKNLVKFLKICGCFLSKFMQNFDVLNL